ncbi:MAG: ECF-type sigma factor [Balneolaceae bacterium]
MDDLTITNLLKQVSKGEKDAYQDLMPKVYNKLQLMANRQLSFENHQHTYGKTDLVHEAYLKLCDYDQTDWKSRNHFFAIASKCMRQILIDYARKKLADKRGGKKQDVTYIDSIFQEKDEASNLIELDEALKKMAGFDPRLAELVEYRFFGEMSIESTAEVMNISKSTVSRDWQKARGWLYKELKKPMNLG